MLKLAKQYTMAIVAVLLVIGFSAFKIADSTKYESVVSDDPPGYVPWYFKGGDETNPDDYTDDPQSAPNCAGHPLFICEILAPEHVLGGPDLTELGNPGDSNPQTIMQFIIDARDNPGPTNASVKSFRSTQN